MGVLKNIQTGFKRTKSKIEQYAEKQALRQDELDKSKLIRLEHEEKRLKLRNRVRNKEKKISRLKGQSQSGSLFFGSGSVFEPMKQQSTTINQTPKKRSRKRKTKNKR